MGQLATQAQNMQMQAMNPERDIRDMVRSSWPQIEKVIGGNLKPDMLLQYCISSINREPPTAQLHAGQRPELLHAVRRTRPETLERGWPRPGVYPPL